MSKVIIVCGLPASGKTTLALELSQKLNIVCLHKDSIKEKLYEIQDLSTLEESKLLGRQSVELLVQLAEEQIKRGVDIVIESPFNFPEDYPRFQKWIYEKKVDLFTVICEIDLQERVARYEKRIQEDRHHAHHDHERFVTKDGFYVDDFDYQDIPGKQLKVKTNQPVDALVEKALVHITS